MNRFVWRMMKLICGMFIISLMFSACGEDEQTARRVDFTRDWKFNLGEVAEAQVPDFDAESWRTIDLPHDWSIEFDFSDKYPATPGGGALPGGIGWYRKKFQINKNDENKHIYIDFDGVYQKSKVWINGNFLGERPNGYISFRYDLTPYLNYNGENVIAVRVDNSKQPNSRWYSGSGIYRNVWLTKVNKIHVDNWGTYVTTPEVTKEKASVRVAVTLKNTSENGEKIKLTSILLDAKGKKVSQTSETIEIPSQNLSENVQFIDVDNPELWSIEKPYLYTVVTEVKQGGKILDTYETPLGIRYFSFDAQKGFFLNGEPVKIKGVCNHHDLGCLGAAVNKRAIERQLEILKAMGCNGIRTSHNPPTPELLDLCDQMGFIVMDEAFDMWRKRKSAYDYAHDFPEWHEKDLTDFILRDRNHPSVFIWSIGNEILEQWTHIEADTLDLQQANIMFNFANTLSKEQAKEDLHVNSLLTIKLANMVRELDSTRPVSSGNNETEPYNHIFKSGAMDIIGFNYHINNWGNDFLKKYPGQKLLITESTSGLMSRGFYEMPSDSVFVRPDRWGVRYDRPIRQNSSYDNCHVPWGSTHETSWREVKNSDHIMGMYIWTGFDYLGEPTPYWWPARSSYFGIIDLAGFPKDIYYMYQSEWANNDVLHIFPHWNWAEGDTVDVWAYYNNADEVELFLNDKSLGIKKKEKDTFHVWWRIPFEKGKLKAISRKNGETVLTKEIATTEEPVIIRLTPDRNIIDADGKDLSFVTVEVLDVNGLPVPTANNLIEFSIHGSGFVAGTDNGNPVEHLSLKSARRKLFNGKALAVIQSNGKEGSITLKATSPGLKSSEIEIVVR